MTKEKTVIPLLLASLLSLPAAPALANVPGLLNELSPGSFLSSLQLKSRQPYDESKDPALRQGTENWEQDQGSYFIVPALVLGLVGLALFINRNKSD